MGDFLAQLFSIPPTAPLYEHRDQLSQWLSENFDPNYNALQAMMLQLQNPNKIGSDTRGQTLEDLMYADPRFRHVLRTHYKQSRNLEDDIANPYTPNSLNADLMRYVYGRGSGYIRNKVEPGM